MIDTVKRQTLKRIGASAIAATTAGIAGHALASASAESGVSEALTHSLPLADIQVSTRVSAITNDVEVLITNVGHQATTITQLTPSVTMTQRGQFDFSELMNERGLALAPGQSKSVPMRPFAVQHRRTGTSNNSANQQAHSLTEALRRSFSVVTDNDAFAKVTVVDGIRFV